MTRFINITLALAVAATIGGMARGSAATGTVLEPVRRDASVDVIYWSSCVPPHDAFVSTDLVLPRETTRELADYVRGAGAPTAAEWLCDAYTGQRSDTAQDGSLHGLIASAVATGDPQAVAAADALVCPDLRKHRRILAYQGCEATAAQRDAFDTASCTHVLRGRSGRASVLKVFAKRAATRDECLVVRLKARMVVPYVLFCAKIEDIRPRVRLAVVPCAQ
jgi:hypothetical protein